MAGRVSLKVISIIALLVLAAGCGCDVIQTAQAFNRVGNDFMSGLKTGQYHACYDLLSPELQSQIGDAEDLRGKIESRGVRPEEWTFTSWNITTGVDQETIARVKGSLTYLDGRRGSVSLELVRIGDGWKIRRFDLSW